MSTEPLLTDRLVVLPLSRADLDEVAALLADPEVMRHVAGGPRTRAESADMLDATERTWKVHGWGLWALRDPESGGLVGEAGLQPLPEVGADAVEFGYTIGRRHWGKGIATEAARVVLDDAWSRYAGDTIHATVDPDNLPSRAVLKKLRFRRAKSRALTAEGEEIWEMPRPT